MRCSGLAAIAQRRGEDNLAAHYYAQVMALDPRNAVANAGMSALTTDDNRESRLKTLLNEQPEFIILALRVGQLLCGASRAGAKRNRPILMPTNWNPTMPNWHSIWPSALIALGKKNRLHSITSVPCSLIRNNMRVLIMNKFHNVSKI